MKFLYLLSALLVVLVISITPASATQVNLYYQGAKVNTNPITLEDHVKTTVFIPGGTDPQINVTLFDETLQNQMQTVYVFKCKALTPQSCVTSVAPESHTFSHNSVDVLFSFSSVRDSANYPQTGNVLFVVTTANPSVTYAYWHSFQKTSSPSSVVDMNSELGSFDLVLKTIDDAALVEGAIENDGIVPAGSIISATFSTATGFYELLTDSIPTFSSAFTSGTQFFTPISKAIDFVLPTTSAGVNHGISFVQTSSGGYCGDNACNSGETQSSCCFDCGCSGDNYCDASGACRSNGAVTLDVIPPTDTRISNCNQEHTISVVVQLNSPPTGLQILSQSATIDGTKTQTLSCSSSGNVYTCPVKVAADPACGSGTFLYTPNSITFDVSYPNGGSTITRSITTGFSDITVGSWVCGNGLDEQSLGETSGNCCYDVSCASGQFCDIATGAAANTGVCTAVPSGLQFSTPSPSFFPSHTVSGNTVTFTYDVASIAPKSFSAVESCDAICVSDQPCTATCSIACSPTAVGGTCSLTFAITGYDAGRGYAVSPQVHVQLTHPDGAGQRTEQLSGILSRFAFGASFCGDGTCTGSESSRTCCFDCACPEGEFCSTASTIGPSPGDVCSSDAIRLVIDHTDTPVFIDQAIDHTLHVKAHLENLPPFGVSLDDFSCSLFGGGVPCVIACTTSPQIGMSQSLECDVTMPPVSAPGLDAVELNSNFMTISLSYASGVHVAQQDVTSQLPDITITQIAHCGQDGCEASLGESAAGCCIDCPCADDPLAGPDTVCVPGGEVTTSMCVAQSSISLVLVTPPKEAPCQILPPQTGRGCRFTESSVFEFQVVNAPASVQLASKNVLYLGNVTPANCDPIVDGKFKCYLTHPTIPEPPGAGGFSGLTGGTEVRDVRFLFDAVYQDHQITATKKLSLDGDVTIKRDAREIQSCEQQESKINKHMKKQNTFKTIAGAILIIIAVLALVDIIRCGICDDTGDECHAWFVALLGSHLSCEEFVKQIVVLSCVASLVIPLYTMADNALKKDRDNKAQICAAPDTGAIGGATSDTGISNLQWVGFATTAICLIGAIAGGGGGGAGGGPVTVGPA